MAVTGNLACIAAGAEGLRLINIATPAVPVEVGYLETHGHTYDIAITANHVFIADGIGGVRVVSLEDPSSPEETGYYDWQDAVSAVAASGSYACVVNISRFVVYDISAALGTPPSPMLPPFSFSLSAYPNPFNAATQIRFDVPRSSFAEIAVYDLQGRLVEQLASRMFEAGTHSLAYDAGDRASCMYIVQMTSGEFSAAQKVVLLK